MSSQLHSQEMAAAASKALLRKEKVWLCGRSEGRHATWTCPQDHQGPRRHDQQKVSPWQEGLPWVKEKYSYRSKSIDWSLWIFLIKKCITTFTCVLTWLYDWKHPSVLLWLSLYPALCWTVPSNICPTLCWNCWRICLCPGNRFVMCLSSIISLELFHLWMKSLGS